VIQVFILHILSIAFWGFIIITQPALRLDTLSLNIIFSWRVLATELNALAVLDIKLKICQYHFLPQSYRFMLLSPCSIAVVTYKVLTSEKLYTTSLQLCVCVSVCSLLTWKVLVQNLKIYNNSQ
jgi:hypothetical protein